MKTNKHSQIVCLITGPAGVGKSSITKALAKKFTKSVVVNVDGLRHMIIKGYHQPWPWGNKQAIIQTSLGAKNGMMLADNFLNAGFNVFIEDVSGETLLKKYYNYFRGEKFKVFLLLPSLSSLLKRFDERNKISNGPGLRQITQKLHKKFSTDKNKLNWQVIDSSNQTLVETTEEIYSKLVE